MHKMPQVQIGSPHSFAPLEPGDSTPLQKM
jgi:hypothetical protein